MTVSNAFREIHWQSHDGLRLYARIYDPIEAPPGEVKTVLCLHGLTRNSRDFEELAPHLQTHYRVVAPDLRGRGFSSRDPQPQNYNPAVYVQDVVALLNATQTARVAVIGTSLGGIVGMMLGYGHPTRMACLVLNDIGPEVDPVGLERIKGYAGKLPPPRDWGEAIAQTRSVFGDAWPRLAEARWPGLARRAYREDAAGVICADADPMIGEVMRNAPAAGDLWPLWGALAKMPMLAIRGAHSDILSEATLARMKREKPDLEQLTVADRGHAPLLDEPGCLPVLNDFLARQFR
jgi:pimeloyl-ACP methyl ester carboxylesterase